MWACPRTGKPAENLQYRNPYYRSRQNDYTRETTMWLQRLGFKGVWASNAWVTAVVLGLGLEGVRV